MGFQKDVKPDMSPRTVIVHRVELYDDVNDELIVSRRFATEEGAKRMNGFIIPNTAYEISVVDLEPGEQWTAKGYVPKG